MGEFATGEGERGERIVGLAHAIVERALALPDAAEVEAHAGIVERDEGLGERLRNLVVERAALLRMRVSDERDAARLLVGMRRGQVERDFERPGRTGDRGPLLSARQILSLSTTLPCTTCESMISSMSWRST